MSENPETEIRLERCIEMEHGSRLIGTYKGRVHEGDIMDRFTDEVRGGRLVYFADGKFELLRYS